MSARHIATLACALALGACALDPQTASLDHDTDAGCGGSRGLRTEALVTGPTQCDDCNPSCFQSSDSPGPVDLTPETSTDLVYDDTRGGVRLLDPTLSDPLPDADGDGVPDAADGCVGNGYRAAVGGGGCDPYQSLFYELPYGGEPQSDPLDIYVFLRSADVYFLIDTTGSMGGELAQLQLDLTSGELLTGCSGGVLGAIRCTIPDVWFGVGAHDDYPLSPYGSGSYGDAVYTHVLDMSSSLSAAQTAINSLRIHWGNDGPESQTQALWAVASGGELTGYLGAQTCATAGRWGYPCFRGDPIPIIVHITDAPYHEGPGEYPFRYEGSLTSVRRTYAETIAALQARQARVITMQTCGAPGNAYCDLGESHARSLGADTGSTDGAGDPYVFRGAADGTGLSTAIVDAVVHLAQYERQDVTTRVVGDTRGFVRAITATGWGPTGNCESTEATRFVGCLPGTPVRFRVEVQNDAVTPIATPQVFDFAIDLLAEDNLLRRVPVRVLVPPVGPFEPEGRYVRDHDGAAVCGRNESPHWEELEFSADVPAGTHLDLELQVASSVAGLASATPIAVVTVPTATSPIDVEAALEEAGLSADAPALRVTAALHNDSSDWRTPVFYSMTMRFFCRPSE